MVSIWEDRNGHRSGVGRVVPWWTFVYRQPRRLGVLAVSVLVLVSAMLGSHPTLASAGVPTVEETWVTTVSATGATLHATINPQGLLTKYRFEYSTSESILLAGGGESVPTPPTEGNAGTGNGIVAVEAHPQDLQPGVVYYFQVAVAHKAGEETTSASQSFTTQSSGGELTLPDGRSWELVSPPPGSDGATASFGPPDERAGLIEAAEGGSAITYIGFGATEVSPAGYTGASQMLSAYEDGRWSSRDIATPHEQATGFPVGEGEEYRFFSSDLSVGLVEPLGPGVPSPSANEATPLSPCASERTIYLRSDTPLSPAASEQGIFKEASLEGGYKPLVTAKPGCANVPEGAAFGGEVEFEDASPDLNHIVLSTGGSVRLTQTTPEGDPTVGDDLYEWTAGREPSEQLQVVSILPPPGREQAEGMFGQFAARGAVSDDGSRIVWSHDDHLYMRDVANEETVQLDAPEAGAAGGSAMNGAQFQFANAEGSQVLFTDEAQLTVGRDKSTATTEEPDLYECEMVETAGKLSCRLSDLTVDSGQHANVQGGVLGVGDEGLDLYFVAEGRLTEVANGRGEPASSASGARNLYLLRYDETAKEWGPPVFIAALSSDDSKDWGTQEIKQAEVGQIEKLTSRVSPSGEYLAFMSERSLTGYDNRDAVSGARDEEVFVYDARSNHLACVSCNPTGERPVGVRDYVAAVEGGATLIDEQGIWRTSAGRWLAGVIPAWMPGKTGASLYQARYLSNEGRLFFESPDALVPQATNGLADVYEYESLGVGGCESVSETFSREGDGCIGLISSGSSSRESAFLDASGMGPGGEESEDVFFLSSAKLVLADTGTGNAVYDAHVCSGASPCQAEAVPPPPCATTESCGGASPAQPSIFGASGSATFTGLGNLVSQRPTAIVPKKCSKGKRLRRGKCVKHKAKTARAKARKADNRRRAWQ